jgi:choline/glycine/proline betaine transport protein
LTNSDSSALKLKIHPTVFWTSTALIFFFVAFSLFNLAQMKEVLDAVQHSITTSTGWLFIAAVNIYLAIVVYLLFSRYGSIRLGGADARPEFTTWGWFSMLFSAGMGIGLVFWSVAEPIFHYSAPPWGEANTVESAELAMGITFFHWGLHAWALYALMALGLAYFSFNRGLPLTIRSVFYPILGERIHGWMGNTIDILAAVATLFGLATSLGLGAQQVNAGLDYLFAIGQGSTQQILLIAGITLMATVSVVLGLDKGIRRLSQFNMAAAIALLVFVFIAGPSLHLLDALVQNIGAYLANLPKLSLWTEAYGRGTWQHSWTIFYWACRPSLASLSPVSRAGAPSANFCSACCWSPR